MGDFLYEQYAPNEGYNINIMEVDGSYRKEFEWCFFELETQLNEPVNMYEGEGPVLNRDIANKLKNVRESV